MFIKNGSYKKHTHIISYVPPTIITQPVGDIKNVGTYFKFFISAKGSKPLTYQWYKNYNPILNETSNELILSSLQLSDDGSYFCEVRNNGYLLESDIVDLTVIDSLSFSQQPESVSANPNSNVSFNVTVDSSTSVYYQWYKNSLLYPGTTDTLYINYVTENEEGTYFCVASNLLTSITSNSVTLTVNDPIIIKEQPQDTTLINGDNLTLNLSCVGTFPISAQWRKDSINYGSLSTTNTGDVKLQINNIQPTDEGNYDCVLSNVVGSVTSNKALVYINRPPTFILNPSSAISILGNSFTFNSNASGTNPISYQWIKENEGNIATATLKNYTLSNIQFFNSGNYACVATNLYGSVTSTFASLSVGTLPEFIVHPLSQAIAVGSNCTFNVVATGTNPISYQWYKNNTIILSAESDSYTINSVTNLNNGNYSCVASNILGSVTSNSASLITGAAPTITVQPSSQKLYTGSNVTFSVAAIGSIPLSYQWYKNNIPILNATNNSYTINSISESNVGDYRCSVSNIFSSVISNSASLDIIETKIIVKSVDSGAGYSLALGSDDTLSAWGNNNNYRLGDGTEIHRYTPIKINLPPVVSVAAGVAHSFAIGTDGTLSAWGSNTEGQLGNGTRTVTLTAIKINLPPVVSVAAGTVHSLAIGTDGTLSAWGNNSTGQLGDGTTTRRTSPTKINLPPVVSVAAAGSHSFAIGTDGTLSAWGSNNYGQLGDGTTTRRTSPTKINLPPVVSVAAKGGHTLFLGNDGTLSACGNNDYGQLGNGTTLSAASPIKINLPPVSGIAVSHNSSFAIGIDGTLSAWGNNDYGQLGNGTTLSAASPIKINLPPVYAIASYTSTTLAIGIDGTLSAWGRNDLGQIGDGTTIDRLTPFKIF